MSQRSATLTVLRRISEYVTPPLKRLADRRLFRRSKISLPLHATVGRFTQGEMTAVQYTPACWIPISKSKHKVILAGDPCQLPPTIKSIQHASTSKKNTPGKALPKIKEIVEGKKGNLVAGKAFKAKDDDSKSKETKSIDAKKTEGNSKDNWTEIQPTQSTSNGKSKDKSDSDGSQTEKETKSFEKFTAPSGLGKKPSTPAKWNGHQFFKMKPSKLLEVTMFDRLLKSNSSISCLLDV
ncbi:hypothetical protein CROQUDRAFT_86464 [Cronartium quercuum f. sp. fusiforme G11]|uniref:DNA2/NAM7 helicase helicase domain-containing protein n=1 Tax=Cronartium quercuum f. sp. fusiforme G11 TaxID=708437 RepID=A0A9P6NWR9_9BASI|nr:hypothetical protein CROQUDRAFT_86464 [Cronartium quercuum f. sp. fusiforme G11]